jgi:hypothetical protein
LAGARASRSCAMHRRLAVTNPARAAAGRSTRSAVGRETPRYIESASRAETPVTNRVMTKTLLVPCRNVLAFDRLQSARCCHHGQCNTALPSGKFRRGSGHWRSVAPRPASRSAPELVNASTSHREARCPQTIFSSKLIIVIALTMYLV